MKPGALIHVFTFFLIIFPIQCFPILAQTRDGDVAVQVEGHGVSRADALLDARRNAVETGIGTVVVSETEMRNFQVKKDIVLTRTLGAVRKYEILHEEKQTDGNLYIKIDAVVSLAAIRRDLAALKILLESMDRPRMMVVAKEEQSNAARTVILDFLSEKGFELVDPAQTAALMQKDDALIRRAAQGDAAAAAKIGSANGAEYIISATVTKGEMKADILGGNGMVSGQADISAKVVNCSTGRVIASKQAHGAAVHVAVDTAKTMAVQKAAQNLMDQALFEKIVDSFQTAANNGGTLEIIIEGVANYSMQKKIHALVSEIPRVVSATRRGFGSGRLEFSVQFKGNTDAFAEAVDGKILGDKTLSVTGLSANRVHLRVQ